MKVPRIIVFFVLVLSYVLTGYLGLRLGVADVYSTLIWPPSGIAIFGLIFFGIRLWPAVTIGAFLVNFISSVPLLPAIGIAVGNTLEAVVAVWILNYFHFRISIGRMRDVFVLAVCGAFLSSAIAATVGLGSLQLASLLVENTDRTWWTWWLGDAMSILILVPLFCAIATTDWEKVWVKKHELLLVLGGTLSLALIIFSGGIFPQIVRFPKLFLLFPAIFWAAGRFGHLGSTISVFIIALVSIVSTTFELGPFRFGELPDRYFYLHAYLGGITLTSLFLAAALVERDETRNRIGFLSEVGALMSSSMDFESNLKKLAQLIVPKVSDCCAIHILDDSQELVPVAVECTGKLKHEIENFMLTYKPQKDRPRGLYHVVSSVEPEFFPKVTKDLVFGIIAQEKIGEMVAGFRLRSGIIVPLQVRGRVLGTLSLATTDIRELGREDLKLAVALGERAAIGLENAKLYQKLQRTSRIKDDFISTLSHEIRTPLSVIQGWSDLLSQGEVDKAKYPEIFETIHRNTNNLMSLISDILDLSRILNGQVNFDTSLINLSDVVRLATESVRLATAAKHLNIEMNLSNNVTIRGDAVRLQQVIWNLLANAIKFTPNYGTIRLTLQRAGENVEFIISDTGRGILPDFLPFVFERFAREDSNPIRSHEGLGLGLSIVKQIVEMHGGVVEVSSEGRSMGATFKVTLPAA